MRGALVANRRVRQSAALSKQHWTPLGGWRELAKLIKCVGVHFYPSIRGLERHSSRDNSPYTAHTRPPTPRRPPNRKMSRRPSETIDQISDVRQLLEGFACGPPPSDVEAANAQSRSNQFAGAEDVKLHAVEIVRNAAAPVYYEAALQNEKGSSLTSTGALAVRSGAKTGRSPKDKRVVAEPTSEANVWWGPVNIKMSESSFMVNRERAIDYLNTRDRLFVVDACAAQIHPAARALLPHRPARSPPQVRWLGRRAPDRDPRGDVARVPRALHAEHAGGADGGGGGELRPRLHDPQRRLLPRQPVRARAIPARDVGAIFGRRAQMDG